MTLSHRISIALLSVSAAVGITLGAAWLGYQTAGADVPVLADAGVDTMIDAGVVDAGGSATAPAVSPIGAPLDELAALKAKYDTLKAAKDSGSKDLLWFAYAALAAGVLRVLLAAINAYRGDKPKTWAKWTALGLAVPIALLTYYGAGAGLWASLVMAGSGPGAIIVNELLKRKAPASS